MEILVNQEPLSYTLEPGDSLGDIIDGVADWLTSGNYAITSIDVDNQSLPIHDRSRWSDVEVDSVDKLSIEAFPNDQVRQSTLAALADYCVLLDRALEGKEEEALTDLAGELPYVRARIHELLPGFGPDLGDNGNSILTESSLDNGQLPDENATEQLRVQLRGILSIIESRLRELEDPARELALTLGYLVSLAERLQDTALQLQTGENSQAMKTVVSFTDHLSRVLRILPSLPEGQDIDGDGVARFALDLTPHLQQLQEAFEMGDSVLIGDLLEYEIAPRLKELPTIVGESKEGLDDR